MSIIRIGGFRGEIPRVHPRLLPEGAAQTALNIRTDSGAVEPIKGTALVQLTTIADPISFYRYSASIWLEATTDVDWVSYPVAEDLYGRVIFADPSANELRVTDSSLVGAGGYPAAYRRLDVPPPDQGFSATLQGTADDTDEVPETRYYVCTFVNSWGAEGPPSPASNQIEWRTGQTVLLEGLPSVPTGNYDISHRRIYRVNTGSTGITEYQYVTEIAVASAFRSISAITQANPVVVSTTTAHGFSDGQEVTFSGLGSETPQALASPGVTRTNPARVYVTGHGLTDGQTVVFDDLGGGNGMDELQGVRATIAYINADSFDLVGIDATAYTPWVTGGTVAEAHGMDELNGNSYIVSVIDLTSFSLVGINGTGYVAYSDEGTVTQVAGTSYTDAIPSASLGEVLPTELYDPPNDATIGIKEHPGGFLVGFFGKTLCFSELGAPHAWPIDYRLVASHDIVGLGVFGNTVAVVTKGWPMLAIGSDPSAMNPVELEIQQACVAKRGIVDFGSAIAYPSPDGLIVLSGSGVVNATAALFTRDQWQALVPSSFVAYDWENKYLCFYDDGTTQRGFILDPFDPTMGVRYVAKHTEGAFKDIEEDLLYCVQTDVRTGLTPSSTVDTLMSTGHIDALDFGTGSFTVEALVKQPVGITYGDPVPIHVFKQHVSAVNGGVYMVAFNDGVNNGVTIHIDDSSIDIGFSSFYDDRFPDDGKYHHIALVIDRSTDQAFGYVDGVLTGGPVNISFMGSISGGSTPFYFFTDFDIDPTYWLGSIAEVRFWNTARTATEIADNYQKFLQGDETGLVVYWPFNGTLNTSISNNPIGFVRDEIFGYDLAVFGTVTYTLPSPISPSTLETWDQGDELQYTWKSRPTFTPHAVNMSAAKVIADAYPVTIEFYVDDVKRHTRVVQSIEAFRLPGGFKGEKFELVIKSKKRVSEVAMATTMRELSVTV